MADGEPLRTGHGRRIEQRGSVADLIHNVPKAEAVRSSVDEYLSTQTEAPDFVLADPPRADWGSTRSGIWLRMKPKRITHRRVRSRNVWHATWRRCWRQDMRLER